VALRRLRAPASLRKEDKPVQRKPVSADEREEKPRQVKPLASAGAEAVAHAREQTKERKKVKLAGAELEPKQEEDRKVQAKHESSAGSSSTPLARLSGPGDALSSASQAFYGARLGYDFGQVRVHQGEEASESARELRAKAYTCGHHVVFGEGQYDTTSLQGRKLLAHELTHVVQQGAAPALEGEPLVASEAAASEEAAAGQLAVQKHTEVTE
jgi:hypothetical protein